MNRYRIVIVGLFSLLFFVSTLHAGQTRDFPDNLTFTTFDGKTLDSAALKSAPLVLIISAAWCPECKRQAPEVQKAYLEYKDRGVQFLSVFGGSREDEIKEFMEIHKVTYPLAKDNGIAEFLDVRPIPQTFFFSKGGKFEKRIMGPVTHGELVSNIEKMIGK